jgi:hypothetical protein
LLVITAFFSIAFPAGHQHVPRNMQTRSITIHPVKVLIYVRGLCEAAETIGTTILEALPNKAPVLRAVNFNFPIL